MKRFSAIVGILLIVGVVFTLITGLCGPVTIWDGYFDLTVDVATKTAAAIVSTRCEAFAHREEAQFVLDKTLVNEPPGWLIPEQQFTGKSLVVQVPVSGRESFFGIETARFQFQHLLLIVKFADGNQLGKIVDIPDGRVSKSISVEFP